MRSGLEDKPIVKPGCYKVNGLKGQHANPISSWLGHYSYEHKSATAVILTDAEGVHLVIKALPKTETNPKFSVKSEYVITMKSLKFNGDGYAISFGEFSLIGAEHNVPIPGLQSPLNKSLSSKEIALGQERKTSDLLVRIKGSKLLVEIEPSRIKAGAIMSYVSRLFTRTVITGSLEQCELTDEDVTNHKKHLQSPKQ